MNVTADVFYKRQTTNGPPMGRVISASHGAILIGTLSVSAARGEPPRPFEETFESTVAPLKRAAKLFGSAFLAPRSSQRHKLFTMQLNVQSRDSASGSET